MTYASEVRTRIVLFSDGDIRLISYELTGELLQDLNEESALVTTGKESIISPPYIYKVFRVVHFILSSLK